jgi:hypothetical protein
MEPTPISASDVAFIRETQAALAKVGPFLDQRLRSWAVWI